VKTFNKCRRDDHCSLDAACDLRLTSHALQCRSGEPADAVSRANNRQADAERGAEINEGLRRRWRLSKRRSRESQHNDQAHHRNADKSIHVTNLLRKTDGWTS
jgi:hypothetical protein